LAGVHTWISTQPLDLEHAKRSVGNAYEQLERIKSQVDGFHSSLKSHSRIWGEGVRTNTIAIHQVDTELEALKISFFNKLEKSNMIVGKALVWLEEELDKVVAHAGERINFKLGEISSNFTKAMETEEAQFDHHCDVFTPFNPSCQVHSHTLCKKTQE
jgi:hypothetical protein